VLELSLRETLRLHDTQIRSGHLLLGLLREGEGLGAKILAEGGADFDVLRQRTEEKLRRAA
jgi:ATP-dependent Clp protease ATP-binding subunit ClpA